MIDASGYEWKIYLASFDSPEGNFSFEIHAISFDHAQLQIDAIRETARLDGELIERIPFRD
jgi:hypothetical protein